MNSSTFLEGFHDLESVESMTYSRLGKTEMIVSEFGYGAAALGNVYNDNISNESKDAFLHGLKSGINYIDTAPWYGQGLSEERLGEYLKDVPRSTFYMATKVGRYELDPLRMFDFSGEKTKASVEKSLKLLGLNYIDLIQIHDIEFAKSFDVLINETIPVLQELKASGKVKHIGITSYNLSVLKKLIRLLPPNTLDTVLSYAKFNIMNMELLDELRFFESVGIGVINAAPTGMGLLTEHGIPDWHPGHPNLKNECKKAALFCKSKGVDIAHLAISWAFSRQEVPTTLISSPTMSIMKMNLSLCLWKELSTKDTNLIKELQAIFFDNIPIVNWDLVEVSRFSRQ
uniref:D-arabinose 1-dehydrogenase n=1 Tax=Caligus clemensi TaxID=344056 RepID=C1C2J4_CALCM|nr:D-arabinose 1-dehydrogenase [Caligus clemensi]